MAPSFSPHSPPSPTYWQDVRPILRKHCTVCHSERKLDEPERLRRPRPRQAGAHPQGRQKGKVPVLVPGKPDESLLVTLLTAKDKKRAMPLDADPLSAADIATIRQLGRGRRAGGREAEGGRRRRRSTPRLARSVRKLDGHVRHEGRAAASRQLPGSLELTLPVGPLPPVAAVAFSPDGKLLAAGSYGRVTVWDLATAKPVKVLTNVLGAVNDLKFSPDGKLLAVAGGQPSARGDLRLFDTTDWKLVATRSAATTTPCRASRSAPTARNSPRPASTRPCGSGT